MLLHSLLNIDNGPFDFSQLVELQRRVRSNVSAERWLHEKCAYADMQLYDWGIMRLRYPFSMYGIGDAFAMEADDRHRKKRDSEVIEHC